MANPGSEGEHELQRRHGTEDRAQVFYRKQMLTYLNDDMRRYIARQEMVFICRTEPGNDLESRRTSLERDPRPRIASGHFPPSCSGRGHESGLPARPQLEPL